MFKTKDFYLLKVYDIKGKYLGVVDDLCINFNEERVEGFFVSNFSLFSKKNYVKVENIISLEDVLIVKEISSEKGLSFKSIKDMDIIDKSNVMRGVLEDLIIEEHSLYIKGLIMSSGIFDKMIKGKEILLLKECVLGEDFILYHGNDGVKLKTIPHRCDYEQLQEI